MMPSFIKIFFGLLAGIFMGRVMGFILAIVIGFLLFKYFTEPKYIITKIDNIKKIYQEKKVTTPAGEKEANIILFLNA